MTECQNVAKATSHEATAPIAAVTAEARRCEAYGRWARERVATSLWKPLRATQGEGERASAASGGDVALPSRVCLVPR